MPPCILGNYAKALLLHLKVPFLHSHFCFAQIIDVQSDKPRTIFVIKALYKDDFRHFFIIFTLFAPNFTVTNDLYCFRKRLF